MKTLICICELSTHTTTISDSRRLLETLGSDVTLLAIRPPGELPSIGASVLDQAANAFLVPPEKIVAYHPNPAEHIIDQLNRTPYDLLILGAHDCTLPDETTLGEFTLQIVSQTQSSLLILRSQALDTAHILLTTGGGKASEKTVRSGARLAAQLGASVTLLHVTEAFPSMYAGLQRIEEQLTELLQSDTPVARHLKFCAELFESLGIEAQIELRRGIPRMEIVRATERSDTGLVILGKSQHSIFNRLFVTPLPSDIAAQIPASVLVLNE